jgi:hypothetical protein
MATLFGNMGQVQRDQCLAWAKSHDWGGQAPHWHESEPASILVTYCAAQKADGEWFEERQESRNMTELRDWAGY